MAKYIDMDGRLVPVGPDGQPRRGTQFHAARSSRVPFSQQMAQRRAAMEDQARTGAVSAPPPAPAAVVPPAAAPAPGPIQRTTPLRLHIEIRCDECGLEFPSVQAARRHQCYGGQEPQEPEGQVPPERAERIKETVAKMPQSERNRWCQNPECDKSLPEDSRPNALYCDKKCKARAKYLRTKAKGGTDEGGKSS